MKIIGFTINKILIEKKKLLKGKVNLKNSLNINEITKENITVSDKPALRFEFEYIVNYEPGMAKLEIKGSVIGLDEKDESKVILKEWKKKKFTHPVKMPLYNFIINKCNIKAIQLEDELGLPLHVPFPKLRAKTDGPASYTG